MNAVLRSFHLGVDLGKLRDHSAFVVVEQRVESCGFRDPVSFEMRLRRVLVVRLVERVRLGTGYEQVMDEMERLTQCEEFRGSNVTTAFDATGIGMVVEEGLRRRRLQGELYPVVIHGGLAGSYRNGQYPTPRTELLLGVQRAFEVEGLVVAAGVVGWEALVEELQGMRQLPSLRGPSFVSEGKHDDLVFALALALFGTRMRVLPTTGARVRARREVDTI
ncbi:hypothetical protein [Bryobacter aggregatus]|uniref:hypothetical protein n=1 Tax=Bryobacter aggregatus TaxID=360054 RepID=UPI0004E1E8F0|nr:hypothetical protein [Bryobacter aggregatus]